MILLFSNQYGTSEYLEPLIKKFIENKIDHKIILKKENAINNTIEKYKPKLIILSATGSNFEKNFILYAKKKRIPVVSVIDFWVNYKKRFYFNKKYIYPDKILVIDKKCKQEMIKDGFPKKKLLVIGQPHFENIINKKYKKNGKKICYIGQPFNKNYISKIDYKNNILKFVSERSKKKKDQLVYCQHPDENHKIIRGCSVKIIKHCSIKELQTCEIIIGHYSSLIFKAYLMGIKKIIVLPGKKNIYHPFPLCRWGIIKTDKNILDNWIKFNNYQKIKIKKFNELKGSLSRLYNYCREFEKNISSV
jgi:hypothetical protein